MSAIQQVLAAGGAPLVVGQQVFTASGSFVVPTGVTSISVVGVGQNGQSGGSLSYVNTIPVTSGESLTVTVGNSSSDVSLKRASTVLVLAKGGNSSSTNVRQGGGTGGARGAIGTGTDAGAGGYGGAGGYSGNGGDGGAGGNQGYNAGQAGAAGSGGGGGGGGGGSSAVGATAGGGGNGGTVGLLGQGSSGSGGSGGVATTAFGQAGNDGNSGNVGSGGGSHGLRIIWPGNLRQFPSTRTADE